MRDSSSQFQQSKFNNIQTFVVPSIHLKPQQDPDYPSFFQLEVQEHQQKQWQDVQTLNSSSQEKDLQEFFLNVNINKKVQPKCLFIYQFLERYKNKKNNRIGINKGRTKNNNA